MLQVKGFSEAYLREQSPEWVAWANFHLDRSYRRRLANEMSLIAMAASVPHSQEAIDAFQEQIQEIRGLEDEEVAYLLDPDAAPDPQAIAALMGTGMMGSKAREEKKE